MMGFAFCGVIAWKKLQKKNEKIDYWRNAALSQQARAEHSEGKGFDVEKLKNK